MSVIKTTVPSEWIIEKKEAKTAHFDLWQKVIAFADSQRERRTLWFSAALIIQGVFFLPLPAVLIYYFNAPVAVLAITMGCFFTSIISYMGGAGIRTVVLLSIACILIQLITVFVVII